MLKRYKHKCSHFLPPNQIFCYNFLSTLTPWMPGLARLDYDIQRLCSKFQNERRNFHSAPSESRPTIFMFLIKWESKELYFGKGYNNSVWSFGKIIYLLFKYFLFESDCFFQNKDMVKSRRVTFRHFSAKSNVAFPIFCLMEHPWKVIEVIKD